MNWSMVLAALATILISYLLGCCNTSIVVSKYLFRDDVREHGSGNAGLTNFYRVFGKKKILIVILADMLKTVISVFMGMILFNWADGLPTAGKLLGGIGCMLGHMFPVQFEFKGGKGVLAGGTLALLLDLRVAAVVWGVFLVMVILTRFVSLGSISAGVSFPIAVGLVYQNLVYALLALVAGGLLVWRHSQNIKRLLHGEESKLEFHK